MPTHRYVDQPTPRTNRKVMAASLAAPLSAVLISLILRLVPDLGTPENADVVQNIELLIGAVVVMISTWASGYYVRERNPMHDI